MILTNAFSIGMLTGDRLVKFNRIDLAGAKELAIGAQSAVGHVDTAAVFASLLGVPVSCNRVNVTLDQSLLVGQYRGPRLPEGATTLPEGATIEWWHVVPMSPA